MKIRSRALLLLVALLCSIAGARPARADDKTAWGNPFCSADVAVFPWNKERDEPAQPGDNAHYLLSLSADGKSTVTATVILISDGGAYTVTLDKNALLHQGDSDRFYAPGILVGFDKPQNVRYAYVDSVGVDGAAPVSCPTVVTEVRSLMDQSVTGTQVPSLNGAPVTPAVFKQDLPALDCGKAYTPPVLLTREGPDSGDFGSKQLTATVHVYLDSDGHPSNAKLVKSSGVEGIDDLALAAAEQSHYRAANFLCTPVVSEMIVEFTYG
ncbi:MAG TPA: energy transducer TonB [Candidatus Tumulicola sp.]